MASTRPVVGITCDIITHNEIDRAAAATAYAQCVADAGGLPVLISPVGVHASDAFRTLDALVLTGGDDPRTEPFGEPTHPAATLVRPERQAFETELLEAAPHSLPVLGVCLGMQMMALVAGGRLDQHLPESCHTHADHDRAVHPVVPESETWLPEGQVHSKHHQAVSDPGSLRVLARAHDGVIEAIGDPMNPFRLGVQWHPERTADIGLGAELFQRLIAAARP